MALTPSSGEEGALTHKHTCIHVHAIGNSNTCFYKKENNISRLSPSHSLSPFSLHPPLSISLPTCTCTSPLPLTLLPYPLTPYFSPGRHTQCWLGWCWCVDLSTSHSLTPTREILHRTCAGTHTLLLLLLLLLLIFLLCFHAQVHPLLLLCFRSRERYRPQLV